MIKKFDEYFALNEVKTYQLYKGVNVDTFKKIMTDNLIKNDHTFDSGIRKGVIGKESAISATRNIRTAFDYGSDIFEFDMLKLSSKYKIKPFCENPDYYLDHPEFDENNPILGNKLAYMLKDKEQSKLYWRIKTDTKHFDFDICEELIVTDEIDISKICEQNLHKTTL
jgi:hypothetical protein